MLWGCFWFMAGIFVGSLTMAWLTSGSIEDEIKDHISDYMKREEFMQRLYYIGERVRHEKPEERMAQYREILGCDGCSRTSQTKNS